MACVKRINAEQWRSLAIVRSFVCLFCLFKVCRGWKERLAFKYQDIRVCLTQSLRLVVRVRFYEEKDILQIAVPAGISSLMIQPRPPSVSTSPKGLEEDIINSVFDCHMHSSQLF